MDCVGLLAYRECEDPRAARVCQEWRACQGHQCWVPRAFRGPWGPPADRGRSVWKVSRGTAACVGTSVFPDLLVLEGRRARLVSLGRRALAVCQA